jgi:hypothetical protein
LQNDYNRVKKEKAEALERIQELETERENALSSTETVLITSLRLIIS